MEYVVAYVIAIIGGVSIYELYVWLPQICRWLIVLSTKIITDDARERYSEEWHSHLANTPNSIIKLSTSVGFVLAAFQMRLDEENKDAEIAREFFIILWQSFCCIIRMTKEDSVTYFDLKVMNHQMMVLDRKITHQNSTQSQRMIDKLKSRLEKINNRNADQNIWLSEICSRIDAILPKLRGKKYQLWFVQLRKLERAISGIIKNQTQQIDVNPLH